MLSDTNNVLLQVILQSGNSVIKDNLIILWTQQVHKCLGNDMNTVTIGISQDMIVISYYSYHTKLSKCITPQGVCRVIKKSAGQVDYLISK